MNHTTVCRVWCLTLAAALQVGCADTQDDGNGVRVGALHSWGNYHWGRTENPFTLQLVDNLDYSAKFVEGGVTRTWRDVLNTTSSDWSTSTVLDTTVSGCGSSCGNTDKKCSPKSGKVVVCNRKYGYVGWLGMAQIWLSNGHITQGTTKLNDSYFGGGYNSIAWRNLVMCQEVGHTFGLGHNDEDFSTTKGTCMDYSNDPAPNQHPDAHDYDQLVTIYGHLDSVSTLAPAIVQASTDHGEGPDFGKLVASSATKSTYVKDLGGGAELVTVITWAANGK